jgi:hypothetical protein
MRRSAHSLRARVVVAASLGAAVLPGCGGADTTYSASRFRQCLEARDASPSDLGIEASGGDTTPDVSEQVVRDAHDQNGAVRAFTNTDDPVADSVDVLFFRAAAEAKNAAERVIRADKAQDQKLRSEGLKPGPAIRPDVRENAVILDKRTDAQSRVIDECLDESES